MMEKVEEAKAKAEAKKRASAQPAGQEERADPASAAGSKRARVEEDGTSDPTAQSSTTVATATPETAEAAGAAHKPEPEGPTTEEHATVRRDDA